MHRSLTDAKPLALPLDCKGTITSSGYNAHRGRGCNFNATGDRTVVDPLLQPLSGNMPRAAGGVGRVYLPASNSPVLRQVPGSSTYEDQRGVIRHWMGGTLRYADIGAVQRRFALLVVGNLTLSAGDVAIKTTLENLGFSVTVETDASTSEASANDKALVVISESVSSAGVNSKFILASAGVVVLEPWILDDMSMTTAVNLGLVSGSQTNIVDTSANLLAGPAGYFGEVSNRNVATTSLARDHGWGIPHGSATVMAQNPANTAQKQAFHYCAGCTLVNGSTAWGHRVFAPFMNAAAGNLTVSGQRLLEEAILLASNMNFIQ